MMGDVQTFPDELRERFEPVREIRSSRERTIFEARDVNLDRAFAVKVVRVDDDGISGGLDRLKREVDVIVQLRSPHIIPIYDLIELADERAALVMEMVDGDPFSDILTGAGVGPARAVVLLHQLSNAVADMHMRGIVHRNISPEALMLQSLPNGEVFLRLHDFGRVMSQGESPVLIPARDPRYAAPEELEGSDEIDERSDIFSVGAVTYHALGGECPWTGDTRERVTSSRKFPLQTLAERYPELEKFAGLSDLIESMMTLDASERLSNIADVVESARGLMKRYQLVPRAMSEETNVFKPPTPSAISQVGLDATSSSIVWLDDVKRVHTHSMVSEVEIDAEITEICAKHGVILGDDRGRVWGEWPEMATVYKCPDQAPVTAIDAIEELEAIAVGTLKGHVYVGRKLKESWAWKERGSGESVERLALSPDGSLLAVARKKADLEIVDGANVHRLGLPNRRVMSLSWSRDNSILIVLLECQLVVFDRRGVMVYTKTTDPALIRLEYNNENQLTALWVGDDGVDTKPYDIDLG